MVREVKKKYPAVQKIIPSRSDARVPAVYFVASSGEDKKLQIRGYNGIRDIEVTESGAEDFPHNLRYIADCRCKPYDSEVRIAALGHDDIYQLNWTNGERTWGMQGHEGWTHPLFC